MTVAHGYSFGRVPAVHSHRASSVAGTWPANGGQIDAFTSLIPGIADFLWIAPVALLAAIALGRFAGSLRVRRNVAVPYTRKIFHIGIFSIAVGVHSARGAQAVIVYGVVVAAVVLFALQRGRGYPLYEALARPGDAPHETRFIVLPLLTTAIGGLTALLLSPALAAVGYAVAGWGDAIGEPVGTRWGRHRYRVPSLFGVRATRSLEGSAAVLAAGAVAAFPALLLAGVEPGVAVFAALAAAIAGAAAEAVTTHGLDNFTVQVAATAAAMLATTW